MGGSWYIARPTAARRLSPIAAADRLLEIPMNDEAMDLERQRILALRQQRKEIMSLEPEKALSAILDAPQPAALVHSYPEEDLYLLLSELGPQDSLPLLKLASDRQWQYLLDMEIWRKDRLDLPAVTHWLYWLANADPKRIARWCYEEQNQLISLYLSRNIELHLREFDQDPSEFGSDFISDDETYYVRFRDDPVKSAEAEAERQLRDALLAELLRRLSAYDHVRFQTLLLESVAQIPAETEEVLLRWKNVRLAEKGFLPFHEAVGLYQALEPENIAQHGTKVLPTAEQFDPRLPVPFATSEALPEDNWFSRTLRQIQDATRLFALQAEFAGLCNQAITADQTQVSQRDQLRQVVEKVSDYISIGLERLSRPESPDLERCRKWVCRLPLINLFRVGYGAALSLKWKATQWRKQSWFEKTGLPLNFWGERWLGVLGGILVPRPRYFDNYATGVLYREFTCLAEVHQTATILDQIMAVDDLLSLMEIRLGRGDGDRYLSYQNLLLTLWARHYLKLPRTRKEPTSIKLETFKPFYDALWETGGTTGRRIRQEMKDDFLAWLAQASAMAPDGIRQRMEKSLEALFEVLENEFGPVKTANLDPRYILMFLVVP